MSTPNSPEFLYTYTPPHDIECKPPDNFRGFLDEEKQIRREQYTRLGNELNRLDRMFGHDFSDQYHVMPIEGGRRAVYLGRFFYREPANGIWQVIVNDEVTDASFEKHTSILDFTLPRKGVPNHINKIKTTTSRDPKTHSMHIADSTGPLVYAAGDKLIKRQGKDYRSRYTFDHRQDGYLGIMDRIENARELTGILSVLGEVSHEQGYTFKKK